MESAQNASRPRLFLVDAYAFAYRAHFAFARNPLTNSRGENTSAAFGFARFLLDLRRDHAPEYVAVVFDSGRSHREELYPAYKATRKKMPDELRESLPRIREIAGRLGLAVVEVEGWEADDVIGTLARRARAGAVDSVIVSGDKDFYQLVGPGVRLYQPGRSGAGEQWVDETNAAGKLGVGPSRVVDYLALVGDASDNVPGARGVGPKTAVRLLNDFGSLEALLDRLGEVKSRNVAESLSENRDKVLLSRELVTIRTDVEVEVEIEALRAGPPDDDRLREMFLELEFSSLLGMLGPGRSGAEAARAEYELATGPGELASLVAACRRSGTAGIAALTETLEPLRGRLAGIAVSAAPGSACYLPFGHRSGTGLGLGADDGNGDGGDAPNLVPPDGPELQPLRDLLADRSIAKVGHDIKRSIVACRRAGLALAGPFKDVMVASYLLNPGRRSHDLDAVAGGLLGVEPVSESGLLGVGRKRRSFGDATPAEALRFACERADLPLRLWERFGKQLAGHALDHLFVEMEMPLVSALADMETAGVAIDAAFFRRESKRLGRELGLVRDDAHRVAGTEFNLNSTRQLREILFGRMELPVLKRTKTGPSTDSSVLEELAVAGHELPRLLMDYRRLEKLRGTYVDALPSLVDPETGRLHTTFNQTIAATGRLSSSDPNLQNIPVRTAAGREIRRGFVARSGSLLLTADYSQVELRILAHFSRDPVFVAAFEADKDVHRETAAIIFDVAVEDVTGRMRDQAKTVNFATLYGQGPFSLGRALGISQEAAREFIAQYFERFAGVRRYLDEQVEQAKERGYVETLMGRRRYVPELKAKSWNVRQFGERVAQNTPIQGTAADLVKTAMVRLADALGDDDGARMLLQVHDELVFEVEEARVGDMAAIVVAEMESACELAVPLRVDTGSGPTWLDCKG